MMQSSIQFLSTHWFEAVQTLGILATLACTVVVVRSDQKSRRVQTLLQITQSHREIWEKLLDNPELFRVTQREVDLAAKPITNQERLVVTLLVLHINSAYEATKNKTIARIEGMSRDIASLFSLPIPRAVWNDLRHFQNSKFTVYIESHFDDIAPLYKDPPEDPISVEPDQPKSHLVA